MLYMQELIKCPLKVRKEGRGPLPAGEGTGLREMSDPPEPVSDRGGDVPGARLPFVGPLPVTCWGIFLAVHHLNRCMPLLDCLSRKPTAHTCDLFPTRKRILCSKKCMLASSCCSSVLGEVLMKMMEISSMVDKHHELVT